MTFVLCRLFVYVQVTADSDADADSCKKRILQLKPETASSLTTPVNVKTAKNRK